MVDIFMLILSIFEYILFMKVLLYRLGNVIVDNDLMFDLENNILWF